MGRCSAFSSFVVIISLLVSSPIFSVVVFNVGVGTGDGVGVGVVINPSFRCRRATSS